MHLTPGLSHNESKQPTQVKTDELKKSLSLLQSYKQALNANNIVSRSDTNGIITFVNEQFCEVTGYTQEEVVGHPHNIVRHPDTPSETFRVMWSTIQEKKIWKGVLKNRKKDGSAYWVDISITPIVDELGKIVEYIAIRHEITELIDQRENLKRIALTDTLTCLGNRYKLFEDLQTKQFHALALINIDNFSQINDFYGQAFGDKMIVEVSNKIKESLRDESRNLLYRIYGDEYAILNLDCTNELFTQAIHTLIEYIKNTKIEIDDEEIYVDVSGSITFEHQSSYLCATMAMRYAKENHKSLIVYDESHSRDKEYQNNLLWNKKLQEAIEEDRVVPYFQAIVDNKTKGFNKYEALMRIVDVDGSIILPHHFIEIAKRTKHYKILTQTMIDKSFAYFKELDAQFSINLDVRDMMDNETQKYILHKLESYQIGNRVVFEIVETEEIKNYAKVIEFIQKVKQYGCKIAIDDFGSGYANFAYLLKLEADFIKIDGSLIKNLDTDEHAMSLVSAIVSFAKDLGILIIAEFVKDEVIQTIVEKLEIDFSQGYYFAQPQACIKQKGA